MKKRDLSYSEIQDLEWLWSDNNISKAEKQNAQNRLEFFQNTLKHLISYVPEYGRDWHNSVFRSQIYYPDDEQGTLTRLQNYLLSLPDVSDHAKAEIRGISVIYKPTADEKARQDKIRFENKQMDDAIAVVMSKSEDLGEARAIWNKMGGLKSWSKINSFVLELTRAELLPLRTTLEELLKNSGRAIRNL